MAVTSCHAQTYRYSQVPAAGYTLRVKPIWIDNTFSTNDKLAIDDAISQWNYVLNGTIVLQVMSYDFDMEIESIASAVNNHGLLIMKITSDNPMVDGPKTAAWVNELGGYKLYVIKDRVPGDMVKGVMLHELGHALGARHQDGNTLMFEKYDAKKFTCIDYATVKQVSSYQMIQLDHLNYCIYMN